MTARNDLPLDISIIYGTTEARRFVNWLYFLPQVRGLGNAPTAVMDTLITGLRIAV